MDLSSVFSAVAHKELVAVDLPDMGSNQHELNGVQPLRDFFSERGRIQGTINWYYFADDEDPRHETASFTFYDARESHPTRSEWRMYYSGGFLGNASVGDRLFLVRSNSGQIFGLVFQKWSALLRAADVLFGVTASTTRLTNVPHEQLTHQELELLRRQILEELNLDIVVPSALTDEEIMHDKFGETFPSTKEMGNFARTQVEVDPDNADATLVRWLTREEELFRALEGVIIGDRIKAGFGTVDEFIEYSLSVQNRRKSRMGFALQNHLAELFTHHQLKFKGQARTEGNNRPDFLFPGEREYRDATFDATLLVMLGVKSTCKDRWRQVLDEADRIRDKHLCTLEPSISPAQTRAMQDRGLTLVVPTNLHATFTDEQRGELMDVRAFINFVHHKQRGL